MTGFMLHAGKPLLVAALGAVALLAACSGGGGVKSNGKKSGAAFSVPIEYHKLANGLKVVLSPDRTVPIVTVAVYYNIGFRIEPRERTGFAHLFEHMMFQGSRNLGKMEFIRLIQTNGGTLNGSTRFDFTNYFEIVPSNKLETILWAEADRMSGLAITRDNLSNQQAVVINEVKVNVLNTPYGGFPWLDMPQYAFRNWYNSHNFYGDLGDIEAANLDDVQSFFDTFYSPNNAALVIAGDIVPAQALAWAEKYFGPIPSAELPARPDLSEPPQSEEQRFSRADTLASRPALAFSYRVPERLSPQWYAFGLLDQILVQGEDSYLHNALVKRSGLTGSVSGGINNGLGNKYNYNGPMLWTVSLFHDNETTADSILTVVDAEIGRVRDSLVSDEELGRALIKIRSELYDYLEYYNGMGKADLLACFALFDDEPGMINRIEEGFAQVTPELLQQTALKYLGNSRRTVLELRPGRQSASQ